MLNRTIWEPGKYSYLDVCAGIIIGCLSVFARSISLTFPVVLLPPEELALVGDFCVFKVVVP